MAARGSLALLVLAGAACLLAFGSARSATVSATLSADGTVAAPRQVQLAFAAQGRLVEIDVRPGDAVRAGELLARLDPAAAASALSSARAGLAAARAQLLQLEQGLSPAERAEQRVGIRRARESLASADRALRDARAAARVDAARLRTAVDQAGAALAADQAKASDDQTAMDEDQAALAAAQTAAAAAASRVADDRARLAADEAQLLADQKKQADDAASSTRLAADAKAILDDQAAVASDDAKLADDGADLGDARSAVATAETRVESGRQAIAADGDRIASDRNAVADALNASGAGAVSESQSLTLAKSARDAARTDALATAAANAVHAQPPRGGTLAAARAAVAVARAAVATAQDSLRATRLVAPFAGTVAAVDGVAGMLVGGGAGPASSITLVDLGDLTVTARFGEAASVLLARGQPATMTIDALEGLELDGRVVSIAPLPSGTGRNAGYATTIRFTDAPAELRPGMSAHVAVRIRAAVIR